jgi:small-conductance mechanosensitive channel
MSDEVREVLLALRDLLHLPLLTLGKTEVTLWTLVYLAVLVTILLYVTGRLRRWIVERLLARTHLDMGVRQAAGSIVRYFTLLVGFVVVLQAAGVDLSALAILGGALGVGIGFGLQQITNNFVSGLIILFERPIKVGDRIELGSIVGDVVRISARATTVLTNDNIAVIVPNSEFVTSRVINWSYNNRDVRFEFPVGVAYRSDPELVRRILLEVAQAHRGVLRDPPPDVLLKSFGPSSLDFVLRVWTREYMPKAGVLRSDLNFAIGERFKEHGIEIPFPQQDIYIRSGKLELESRSRAQAGPERKGEGNSDGPDAERRD